MVRKGPVKKRDETFIKGRLVIARAFLKDARNSNAVADAGDIGNPSMSTIINCAIAFTDVITAKYLGETNKDDHQAVVKLLRAALGNRLPDAQARQLASLLEQKDEIQYGSRAKTRADADRALERLEDYVEWAERIIAE